jgi:hypothetical protein
MNPTQTSGNSSVRAITSSDKRGAEQQTDAPTPVVEERRTPLSGLPISDSTNQNQARISSLPNYSASQKDVGHELPAEIKERTRPAPTEKEKKAAAVEEKILLYYSDPDLQMKDISMVVEHFYSRSDCPPELKLAYDDVKQVMETGTISKDRLVKNEKNKPFFRLLAAKAGMQRICESQSRISFSDKRSHLIDPNILLKFAQCSCAAISKKYLFIDLAIGRESTFRSTAVVENLEEIGKNLIEDISNDISAEGIKDRILKAPIPDLVHGYQTKHFYPILLTQKLAFFTPDSFLFAASKGFFPLAVGESDRGIHGGLMNDPLEIFIHDLEHANIFLIEDECEYGAMMRELLDRPFIPVGTHAALLSHLTDTLRRTIKGLDISDNEKENHLLMAYFLLHENAPKLDYLAIELKTPKAVFDYLFSTYHTILRVGLKIGLDSVESCAYELEVMKRRSNLKPHVLARYELHLKHALEDRSNRGQYTAGTRHSYDAIESIIDLKSKVERDALTEKLYPGSAEKNIPNFREIKAELRKKHALTETAEPTKAYLRELFLWKCQNYEARIAEKIIKDHMREMKDKIYPLIADLPPLDVSTYKDHIEMGEKMAHMGESIRQ